MIRVAIVEDQRKESDTLQRYLADYAAQKEIEVEATTFSDSVSFAEGYTATWQLVLLDIQMPYMDGMTVAEKIRKVDSKVVLVFVTNMSQFAVRGYKVEALDFILKPISYFEFSNMMDKVVKTLQQREFDSLIVCTNRETRRIRVAQVAYIEVQRHKLFYHLQDEVLEAWGSLAALEESLPDKMFSRINSGTIVNLNHVLSVREDEVVLSKETLPLSRRRKKEFLSDLAHYFGEERSV